MEMISLIDAGHDVVRQHRCRAGLADDLSARVIGEIGDGLVRHTHREPDEDRGGTKRRLRRSHPLSQ